MAVPQKTEGPSGRRCEDWTRRKKLPLPDAGIVVRGHRIPPDTRLAGSSPCLTNRSSPRPKRWLTFRPSYEVFGCRPFVQSSGARLSGPDSDGAGGQFGLDWTGSGHRRFEEFVPTETSKSWIVRRRVHEPGRTQLSGGDVALLFHIFVAADFAAGVTFLKDIEPGRSPPGRDQRA